jgi:hypothetical protein
MGHFDASDIDLVECNILKVANMHERVKVMTTLNGVKSHLILPIFIVIDIRYLLTFDSYNI